MEVESSQYADGMRQAEKRLLDFLRTMEAHLEGLHLNRLAEQNARLKERLGETLEALRADLALSSPPEQLQEFHTKFSKAVQHCADAYAFLLHFISQEFAMDFLKGRYEFCRGKYLLYELRAGLPILQQYWVFPDVLAALPALEIQEPDLDVPVGIIRKERQEQRSAYSLYVPEHYTPYKEWPLIVCLHSGYSREDDYLLTWLRAAKSKGYMLLAPKSVRETWSAIRLPGIPPEPILDRRSIRAMLEEVWDSYAVDRRRIYLTGFSDGGIFTYVLGLAYADIFAGIAPVAGRIHPAINHLLQRGQGKDLPIFIVHGEQDPIFAVDVTRQTHTGLTKLGYNVTYTELPDWGHAYPYSINETLVLPWFEGLGAKQLLGSA